MINDEKNSSADESIHENKYDATQTLENNLLNMLESIQTIGRTLDETENKNLEMLELAKNKIANMPEESYNRHDGSSEFKNMVEVLINQSPEIPKDDSMRDFHNVIALNNDSDLEKLPQIMILQSMNKIEDCHNNCQIYSSSSESNCISDDVSCCDSNNDFDKKTTPPVKSCKSETLESENVLLKNELCNIKECFENVLNENQELQSKLRDMVEQNNSLTRALKQPALFKISSTGEIRFPGKKAMEEQLLALKNEIDKLTTEINVEQINQLKLKLVKECIAGYDTRVTHCQCENPKNQDDIDTKINVLKQKIKHMEFHLKQKHEELIETTAEYESSNKENKKLIAKIDKLSECITALNNKIKTLKSEKAAGMQLKDSLNKKSMDNETMELTMKKNADEIKDYDEKVRVIEIDVIKKVKEETEDISGKTMKLQNALKKLSEDFNAEYKNLESVFQEQMEEMMALPSVLKVTHIKLQEEEDIRVLAEEMRDKLKRQIKQTESLKKPDEPEDESTNVEKENDLISTQLAENQTLESKLNFLAESIKSANVKLSKETEEFAAVNQEVENATQNSKKQIRSYEHFLTTYKDGLASDLNTIQKLLSELYGKECEKGLNKKEVVDKLKSNIESIYQILGDCVLDAKTVLYDQPEC